MSEYVLITDSSADLSQEMVQELGVTVLPLSFTIQGKTYRNYPDNREMDLPLFYDMLRAGELATTSAVNVAEYTQAVEPILQEGKDVLILAFSSGLSSTYQASVLAAGELREKYPDRKIYTVDTLCASLGQGLLVYLAAQEQRKGKSIEEVRDWAEETKLHLCHQFTVDDLHFLKRGGRISATTAVGGLHAPDQARPPRGQRGAPDQHRQGPGTPGIPEGPGGQDGEDGDRGGQEDGLYQPRGLPQGRGDSGGYGAGAIWNPGYPHQLRGSGDRSPLRSGDPGAVLSGDGAVSKKSYGPERRGVPRPLVSFGGLKLWRISSGWRWR